MSNEIITDKQLLLRAQMEVQAIEENGNPWLDSEKKKQLLSAVATLVSCEKNFLEKSNANLAAWQEVHYAKAVAERCTHDLDYARGAYYEEKARFEKLKKFLNIHE